MWSVFNLGLRLLYTHLSRPVSLWKRLSNLRILLAATVKQDRLLYIMLTFWINRYNVPLASLLILVEGPQKMITELLSARCRSSLSRRTTLNTLEWAATLREVRLPTSVSYPIVGASFIRITHSAWSISAPSPVPRTWLELVTSAQVWQWRFIFWEEQTKLKLGNWHWGNRRTLNADRNVPQVYYLEEVFTSWMCVQVSIQQHMHNPHFNVLSVLAYWKSHSMLY